MTSLTAPSPLTRLQKDSMLHKLVSESDSKFVAVHEEVSEGSLMVDQLHGIQACQANDVICRNWQSKFRGLLDEASKGLVSDVGCVGAACNCTEGGGISCNCS